MKVFKKVINIIVDVVIVFVLLFSVLIAVMALTSKSSGVPNLFGYSVQTVQSNSMQGDKADNFEKGDIIICNVTSIGDAFEVGDVVTFMGELQGAEGAGAQPICHRIIDVVEYDGETYYQTQGDNRAVAFVPDQRTDSELLTSRDIVSVYHGTKLAGLGTALDFLQSQLGFFLCIILPMIAFFLYELVRVVIAAVDYRNTKNKKVIVDAVPVTAADTSTLTDEQKQLLLEQLLAEKQLTKEHDTRDSSAQNSEPAQSTTEQT